MIGLDTNVLARYSVRDESDAEADQGLDPAGSAAAEYLRQHDQALRWAAAYRALIAHRVMTALNASGECRLDIGHNEVQPLDGQGERLWLHRKGAAPADRGPVVIPGSRGTLSYLVQPCANSDHSLRSLAHGAGRKWKRGEARSRLSHRQRPEDLMTTALGGWVICEDKELLYDEAPENYKGIDQVVADLREAGLIEVIATLRPVLTYKVRRTAHRPSSGRPSHQRSR